MIAIARVEVVERERAKGLRQPTGWQPVTMEEPMVVHFVLNEQGEPTKVSDVEEWLRWFERADRSVARTVVTPDVAVLTTFTGVVEIAEGEPPLLFETRVFGGVLNGEEQQHPTRDRALAAHATLVEWCRVGNSPDCGVSQEQIL